MESGSQFINTKCAKGLTKGARESYSLGDPWWVGSRSWCWCDRGVDGLLQDGWAVNCFGINQSNSDSIGAFSCLGAVYVGGINEIWIYMGERGFVPICYLNLLFRGTNALG